MTELARVDTRFNERQLELITDNIAKGASPQELDLFLIQCERTKLDPFSRQIYSIGRYDNNLQRKVFTTQISIDGMRLIAERTGKYRGQTETLWCDESGAWLDVWLKDDPPSAAKVGVYHADFTEPLYAVARFNAYAQTTREGQPTHMWRTKGDIMIAKCAESLALRKAFPHDLSGLYTTDEMVQDAPFENEVIQAEIVKPVTVHDPKDQREDAIGLERAEVFINGLLQLFGVDNLPNFAPLASQFFNIKIQAFEPMTVANCSQEELLSFRDYLKESLTLTKEAASSLHKQIGGASPYDPSKFKSDKEWLSDVLDREISSFTEITYQERQDILNDIKDQ